MHSPIDIAEFLRSEVQEPFLFAANPGNAGDALMACATYDLFQRLGLPYDNVGHEYLLTPKNVRNKVVVFSGGGNFNEAGYNAYARLLENIHGHVRKIIVLPHTISGNDSLLSKLDRNVVLICRERVSFDHVKRTARGARTYLAHDMAFWLDVEALLNYKPRYLKSALKKIVLKLLRNNAHAQYPSLQHYWQGLLMDMKHGAVKRNDGQTEAYLFRTDIESTAIPLPASNMDASLAFNFGVTSIQKSHYTVHHLLSFLNGYSRIHTNRLHIAIAAALLGKTVLFRANNYYKCQAVYEFSIKERFPNVIWQD